MTPYEIPTLPLDYALHILVLEATYLTPRDYVIYVELNNSIEEVILPQLLTHLEKQHKPYTINRQMGEVRLKSKSKIYLRSSQNQNALCGMGFYGAVFSGWIGKYAYCALMTCLTRTQGWKLRIYE